MKSVTTPSEKEPIYQKALDAYLRGELRPPPRAPVLRPESDYEQTLPEVGNKMMPIDPSQWFGDQIRVDVYRSGTSNAVRITHLPTGITTISQADVSQLQNRRIAGMMLLQALMVEAENSVDTATSQHQDI